MAQTLSDRAARWIDRTVWQGLADGLAAALAAALPWSTSIATILSVLWLAAVVPTLDPRTLRRIVTMPAGGLPVLLFLVLLIGMLWATGVPADERYDGIKSSYKLLFIPLLIAHFSRSERAAWVMYGFLTSCIALLALSWMNLLLPSVPPTVISARGGSGVPVRDYIAQSNEFTVCVFLLAVAAVEAWRSRRRTAAAALGLLSAAVLADMFSITTSRTALAVLPVLVVLFAGRYFSRGSMLTVIAAAAALAALVLAFAPQVRTSLTSLATELQEYSPEAARTRAGERIEFWTRSIGFIVDAPLLGHGTGSIRDQFRRVATGGVGTNQSMIAANPHNQTFAVAIKAGLLGTATLFALWLAHLLLFCGGGASFAVWIGLVVVVQNIVGSLFNSHLFDFAQGWGYVLGVGVAAGVVLKERSGVSATARPASAP